MNNYEYALKDEEDRLRRENLSLKRQITLVTAQRNEMATELEKLREHSYEKYVAKKNRL